MIISPSNLPSINSIVYVISNREVTLLFLFTMRYIDMKMIRRMMLSFLWRLINNRIWFDALHMLMLVPALKVTRGVILKGVAPGR